MKTAESKVVKIEVMNADQWDAIMAGSTALTSKQMVLAEFEKLEPQQFIIVPIPPAKDGVTPRTQDQFVQDVSVFLAKKDYKADKKKVAKHPTDVSKIVVRRLA